MDISELANFNLSDAVSFHEELNPQLWEDHKLDREVRDQLLLIAEDFVEYLGIGTLKVKDVTISGSNAAYSYTPHSDLDLHIIVDFNDLPNDPVYQELFTAKKTIYNEMHDITVHSVPVELYVQDINQPVQSLGEYSIVHNKWIRIPKKRRANFDEVATKAKYDKLADLIELTLKSKDYNKVKNTLDLLKRYRKAGLEKEGEFGPENLAYKALRKQGAVKDLFDLKARLHAERLSIEEDSKLLDKPEMTIAQLAEKHGVSRMEIATQLDKGIKVELEHTSHKNVAREIALDHIAEDPKYYDKLSKAELEEEIVDETAEENQIISLIAKHAADNIVDIMQVKENAFLSFIQAGMTPKHNLTVFGVKIKDLGIPKVKDPTLAKLLKTMEIKVKTSKNWENDEGIKTHGSYYPGENYIELYFPAHEFTAKKRDSSLQVEIADTLAHEIQHALDDFKSKGNAFKDLASYSGGKDYESYLKLPYEVNARFQQATMDIAKYIATPKKDGSRTTQKDLPELIRYAFEKNQLNNIYRKNQAEYKRLLTRAYKFFQAELNAPKKATPQNIVSRAVNWILGKPTTQVKEASGYIPRKKENNYLGWEFTKPKPDYWMMQEAVEEYYKKDGKWFPHRTHGIHQLVTRQELRESMQDEVKEFWNQMIRLDGRKEVKLKPGSSVSVIQCWSHPYDSIFELRGNLNPKKIADVYYEDGGSISYIQFEDGSTFPDKSFLDRGQGGELDGIITTFFPSKQAAEHMLTALRLVVPAGWKLSTANLNESSLNEASGYIPSKKEKNDPRFKTALTVDVKPDSIKKNANAFNWKTSRAGIPPQARSDGKLAEDLMKEFKNFLGK
jgi:hypothetical protein